MLNVIMLMEKFSKHDYNSEANDLIVLLFVFIKQKSQFDYKILFFYRFTYKNYIAMFKLVLSTIAIYILIEDINLTRNYSPWGNA